MSLFPDCAEWGPMSGTWPECRLYPPGGITLEDAEAWVASTGIATAAELRELLGLEAQMQPGEPPPAPAAQEPPLAPAAQVPAGRTKETAEQRQKRRYQMCIDAGLKLPDNDYARLPSGISDVAAQEGITRQAFSEDVKAHINRMRGR